MLKKILILMTLAVLLAACLPSQQAAGVQEQVNTAIAGTMQVREQIDSAVEQTVAALQPSESTEAPANVDSEIVLQITDTPSPTPTSTSTPFVVVPNFTPTLIPPKYSCVILALKPKSTIVLSRGDAFDIKWRIINTGTGTWVDGIDIKMVSGTDMTGGNRYEINKRLHPGDTYDIELEGNAPMETGKYVMTWAADGPICYAHVSITVK